MVDQCKHCIFYGDLEKCKDTPCSHHVSWYAVEQQEEIDRLTVIEIIRRYHGQ